MCYLLIELWCFSFSYKTVYNNCINVWAICMYYYCPQMMYSSIPSDWMQINAVVSAAFWMTIWRSWISWGTTRSPCKPAKRRCQRTRISASPTSKIWGDKCEEVSSFHCVLSSLIGTYDDVLSSPIGTKVMMNRAHLILYDTVTPILKEKLPQTFRPIRWMENDFRNLTAKVWANLDTVIRSYDFSKFWLISCMLPSQVALCYNLWCHNRTTV